MAFDLTQLIQPASGVLGSIINGLFGNHQNAENRKLMLQLNDKQFQQQQELMDKSFNQSVDMFNMTNEYNTPASQVKRLEEAGLNPAYLFGQGGQSTPVTMGTPQAPSPYNPDFQNPFDFSEIGKNVGQGLDRLLEKQRVANETEKTRAEVEKLASSTRVDHSLEQLTITQEKTEWLKQDELRQNIAYSMVAADELASKIDVNKSMCANFESMINDRVIQQGFKEKEIGIQQYMATTERMRAYTERMVGEAAADAHKAQARRDNSTATYTEESLNKLYMDIWDSYNNCVKGDIDLKYYDQNAKVSYEINKGNLRITNLQGDFLDDTYYARVGNEFVNTFRNGVGALSDCVDLAFDKATFGLRKALIGKQGDFYDSMGKQNMFTQPGMSRTFLQGVESGRSFNILKQ